MPILRPRRLALGALLGGWACGGGGGKPTAPPAPAAPPPAAGAGAPARLALHAARVRGTELRFVEKGSGIPVILVHGSLGTLETWQPQIDALASRFRVIAYSRRYHWPNAAQPAGPDYSLSLHADDLIGLIEALGLERVHLVGSSYGAYVALLATLRRPDLVRSLVLAEPPILPWLARTPAGDSLRRTFDTTVLGAARAAFARGDSVAAVQRFWDGMAGPASRFDALPEAARGRLLRLAFELRLETRADPADYMPALDCKEVGATRNSVLLVTGEKSPRLFHIIAEELARCLPTAETVTVPGAGHAVNADNPAYYNGAVLQFLLKN
jgi:pimeloyl-ACP methyl ester carboxylesterase